MPILSPPCGTAYTPRAYTNSLKDIARDHLEELFRVYDERYARTYGPMHPRVRDLLEAYVRCGDPLLRAARLHHPQDAPKGFPLRPLALRRSVPRGL